MVRIRPATPTDIPAILHFIRSLADYEKLLDSVVADEAKLTATLFGVRPYAEVLIASWNDTPAGFALFFNNYSTFLAKPGIYLEDLFVDPEFRGRGVGKALLVHLAKLTVERACGRLEWSVLDWNESAIGFYKSLGAAPLDEWTIFRVTGDALTRLSQSK